MNSGQTYRKCGKCGENVEGLGQCPCAFNSKETFEKETLEQLKTQNKMLMSENLRLHLLADAQRLEIAATKSQLQETQAQLQQFEWRPIETAPRDGTEFIGIKLWHHPNGGKIIGRLDKAIWLGGLNIPSMDSDCWMPLPAAPKGEK